ncbi:MAG: hypothetical protein PF589_11885 [Gammaproteobacteria bacterium]|jgi:hypothetical protein|nr:hypothetical protein [Gammaproteobacteria bacterium]
MNSTKEELHSTYTSKDNDELISLYTAGMLTDDGYLVLEQVLRERNVDLPSRPNNSFEETYKPRNHLIELWHGQKSLKFTFWLICILGNIGLLLSVIIYALALKPHVMAGPLFAYLAYDSYMLISIWRSSKQSKHRALKLFLILGIIFPITAFYQFASLGLASAINS